MGFQTISEAVGKGGEGERSGRAGDVKKVIIILIPFFH